MIFGENLLALLVLAIGGALAVGNLLALVRPRDPQAGDDDTVLARPPLGRSLAMILFGTVCAIWAIGSLVSADADPVEEASVEEASAEEASAEEASVEVAALMQLD